MNCYYFVGIQCKDISMIKSGFTINCNTDLRYDNILDYFNQCSKNYECYLIKSITRDEDIIEFKDGSYGCHRKSIKKLEKDIKKQKEIELDAWTKDAKAFVELMEQKERSKL